MGIIFPRDEIRTGVNEKLEGEELPGRAPSKPQRRHRLRGGGGIRRRDRFCERRDRSDGRARRLREGRRGRIKPLRQDQNFLHG